jgi:hypothetical protein
MQTKTIGDTVAALIAMAGEARRSAASLQRYQRYQTVHDHRDFAALHRIALVAQEFGEAIIQAEAALSPSARIAIAELASS